MNGPVLALLVSSVSFVSLHIRRSFQLLKFD